MTTEQVRSQFESSFSSSLRLDRDLDGRYVDPMTSNIWYGYRTCAEEAGIIKSEFDIYGNVEV